MSFIENQDFVQNFFTNRPDKSLSKSIGIGSEIGCTNDVDAFRLENIIKGLGELLVIITNLTFIGHSK